MVRNNAGKYQLMSFCTASIVGCYCRAPFCFLVEDFFHSCRRFFLEESSQIFCECINCVLAPQNGYTNDNFNQNNNRIEGSNAINEIREWSK